MAIFLIPILTINSILILSQSFEFKNKPTPGNYYKDIKIYDAGCGSGLVGLELKKYGFNHFDGGDISKELLNQIPANLYNELEQIDLNKNILKKDDFYDVVMCVGTFTFAHVKAHALDEFIRITKKNGFICFTINEAIYIDYGFKSKIDSLVDNNIIKEIEFFKMLWF